MFSKKIKKIIDIEGMHCNHCVMKIENALKEIEQVAKVKVNLAKKQAEVYLNEDVSDEILINAIKNVDFDVVKIS